MVNNKIKRLMSLMLMVAALQPSWAQNTEQENYKPSHDANVKLEQTNLPIVFIQVNGKVIQKNNRIVARMKIINNGEGETNYADTIAHPDQHVDYNGYIQLKYRGNTSYTFSEKKPYSIWLINDMGEEIKASLMGMGRDNDWALQAPYSDKTMMRDILAFELARPWMDWTPHAKFCELVLDGTYYGIYYLSERVSRSKSRLNLDDPVEGDVTGDYLLQLDGTDSPYVRSKYHPVDGNGKAISNRWITMQYETPKLTEMIHMPAGTKPAIQALVDSMENSLWRDDWMSRDTAYTQYIDMYSFIDYQLATELAHNVDGYRRSTFLYKYSDTHARKAGLDSRWKLTLWDFNIAYGNVNYNGGEEIKSWQYNMNSINSTDGQLVPFWWYRLNRNFHYVTHLRERWKQCREGSYSDERITATIDSMANVLTEGGAVDRNQQAWNIAGRYAWPNKYVGQTFEEDVDYMKQWINDRLAYMDMVLMPRTTDAELPEITQGRKPVAFYTIDGRRIDQPQKGINIVRYSDGTTKKFIYR